MWTKLSIPSKYFTFSKVVKPSLKSETWQVIKKYHYWCHVILSDSIKTACVLFLTWFVKSSSHWKIHCWNIIKQGLKLKCVLETVDLVLWCYCLYRLHCLWIVISVCWWHSFVENYSNGVHNHFISLCMIHKLCISSLLTCYMGTQ